VVELLFHNMFTQYFNIKALLWNSPPVAKRTISKSLVLVCGEDLTLQMTDSDQLEQGWAKTGKTCDHPRVEKEFHLGTTPATTAAGSVELVWSRRFEQRRAEQNARGFKG